MTQPGFFDLTHRYQSLDTKCHPLLGLSQLILWKSFGRHWRGLDSAYTAKERGRTEAQG